MARIYCKNCGGEGWLPSTPVGQDSTCPACRGTGRETQRERYCPRCHKALHGKSGRHSCTPVGA